MVAIAIPGLLAYLNGTEVGWGLEWPWKALPPLAGAAAIVAGLRLIYETIALFGSVGEGTLAPWDPTRKLVVRGPYLRVRNPMISGVGLVVLGVAALLGSVPVLIEFVLFAAINAAYIPAFEEPGLVRRFGDDYADYRRAVPRWIPRRTPWSQAGEGETSTDRKGLG
jgi:protein-S-isoprenylcysteine O-methyltransferase Ste14